MIVGFAVVSGASAVALLVVHAITFGIARRIGRYNVVDVAWGIGLHRRGGGRRGARPRGRVPPVAAADPGRDLGFAAQRIHPATVGGPGRGSALRRSAAGRFCRPDHSQSVPDAGFATWFISLPLQLSAVSGPTPRPLLAITATGGAVWLTGVVFEAVGDRQLRVFKSDPAHRGVVMTSGLWAWTRHPNYFGDACVWWGLWLITIAGWWSLTTVLSPALMTYFLVSVTGARLTEKYMRGRPGFAEYQQRTSFFIPRPPRSASS